jgi:spectinomycin phosphotransferase
MKTDTRDIDKHALAQAIHAAYGLDVAELTFMPEGEDAYVYRAGARDGTRYFVRVQPHGRAPALEQVYRATRALHDAHGMRQVVAPYATRHGACTLNLGAHVAAVFPFIDGATLWQHGASDDDLMAAAALLAAVHQCDPQRLPPLATETFANPFEAPIRRALRVAAAPPDDCAPLQRAACRLLHAEHADIEATMQRMQQLGAAARQYTFGPVLTHGDPNLDNFLKDSQGALHLTDWGELAVGPPERDLFAFTGARFDVFLRQYIAMRGPLTLHAETFAFYFYRWTLQEIADYATRLLFQQPDPHEAAHAWAELRDYVPVRHAEIAQHMAAVQAVCARFTA